MCVLPGMVQIVHRLHSCVGTVWVTRSALLMHIASCVFHGLSSVCHLPALSLVVPYTWTRRRLSLVVPRTLHLMHD